MVTRKPPPRLALALALVVAGAAAACGGGGGEDFPLLPTDTPTSTTTPSATPEPPTPTPTVSLATLEGARQNLRAGAYVEAAAEYAALAMAGGEPQLVAEAWLGAGVARYLDGDLAGSIEDLERALASAAGTPSERRVAYLYGLRLLEAGAPSSAAAVLQPFASGGNDVLTPYIQAAYASALAGDGRDAEAGAAWEAALAHPRTTEAVRLSIYRARADAALDAGATALAADWLRLSVGIVARPQVRYELATLAAEIGDFDTFRAQLAAIMVEAPGTPWAEMALADLQLAGYAVDLGQAGYVHYRRRNYTEARDLLAAAVEQPGITPADMAFRTYYLAAAYDDDGFYSTSVPIYDRVATIDPASPYVHRARYWAARALENAGDAVAASTRYVELANSTPVGEFTAESAFRAGFVLLAAGDAAGAAERWDAVAVQADGRFLYWQGRAQELLADPEAIAAYERAVTEDPVSFYGQAAAVRLGRTEVPTAGYEPVAQPSPIDWGAIADWLRPGAAAPEAVDSAAFHLALLGLTAEASALLEQEVATKNLTRLEFLGYIRAAHEAGLTPLAARWATQLAANAAEPPADLARLAYPLDYVELLNRFGAEHGVDPLFLAALIRQESYWDASAVSVASALGLTQVIPSTGAAIAAELGHSGWTTADLFRPAVSLEFGAYYIGLQLDRFGSPLAALSAYNGGPGNAAQWVANAASGDPADFVEAVTFSETRGYVVVVMENYARYQQLYRQAIRP